MNEEKEQLDINKLKVVFEEDKRRRAQEFNQYIMDGSARFRCDLVVKPVITQDGRIVANLEIVALD